MPAWSKDKGRSRQTLQQTAATSFCNFDRFNAAEIYKNLNKHKYLLHHSSLNLAPDIKFVVNKELVVSEKGQL